MAPWLERKLGFLKRPWNNLCITILAAGIAEAIIRALDARYTFISFLFMALIEETSKFFFAAYLRDRISSWSKRSISYRIAWLSLWGLCEVCLKTLGFWDGLDVTAETILIFGLIVLPALIFHTICISLYRATGDYKRVLLFTLVHAIFNYWTINSAPDVSAHKVVQFVALISVGTTALLLLGEAIMRMMTTGSLKPSCAEVKN